MDDAKTYIAKHPWDKEKPEDMARAFDFISKLIDKINVWNDSYMEKSGIMDVYRSVSNVQKKERKGQVSGGIESVLKKYEVMGLSTSPEFYVNMKNPPVWNDLFGWEDQDDDVKQFFTEEAYKVKYGVTINGTFIPPWLYWHVNFFPVFQDLPNGERVPAISRLRDNEWFFAEMYQRARQEKKGLGMFGTRRFGKALLDSELIYTPYGSKKIGFADIGDIIYGDDGKLTTIVGVYPQGFVDMYKVTFEDGRSIVCCGQHQWKVKYHGDYKVMSTMGIIHSDFQKMTIDIGVVVFPSGGG